jgi:branched-chain amino acid transport system substrate-binding protein
MKHLLIGIGLALILLSAACKSRPDRVRVGIALTQPSKAGVQLAAKEINAEGGIGGVPLELIGLEWTVQYDPNAILKWAKTFADTEGLVAVIGHSDSATTLSAAALYNQERVPQIVTIATNPAITKIGRWTYRLCLSDTAQGPALAEYAVKDWQKKRIAVFYVNDDYGRGLAKLFEKRVRELGGEIVWSVMHRNALESEDQELIRLALTRMKREGEPNLIVLFQRVLAANWMVRAIHESGIRSDILGGDSIALSEFIQTDSELKEGMRISQFSEPESQNKRSIQFAWNFEAFAGRSPDYAAAFAYDALYLVRDAVLQGGFSRPGVKSYLDRLIREGVRIEGVAGPYTLGTDHDARRALYVAEVRHGSFRLLKALPVN